MYYVLCTIYIYIYMELSFNSVHDMMYDNYALSF